MLVTKFLKTAAMAVCTVALMAAAAQAQSRGAADDDYERAPTGWLNIVQPTSYWGVRGLTQTLSAEPLGHGRVNIAVSYGAAFQVPDYDTDGENVQRLTQNSALQAGRVAVTWGLSNYVDLFALFPYHIAEFNNVDDGGIKKTGNDATTVEAMFGRQFTIGGQMSAPFPHEIPFRLALHAHLVSGTKDNIVLFDNPLYTVHRTPIGEFIDETDNRTRGSSNASYAGFNYWDARGAHSLDLVLRLSQSLVAGNMRNGAKLHFNQGVANNFLQSDDWLLMLAAGAQVDLAAAFTIGAEINWRTRTHKTSFNDPLWFTPSFAIRTPYFVEGLFGMSWLFGADIALSGTPDKTDEVPNPTRSLEDFRIFTDLVFSFDFLAHRRAEMEREARRSEAERRRLRREADMSAAQRDSIARQARADSLRLAEEMAMRARADSLRAQFIADSLAGEMGDLAARARQDSIAQAMAAAEREAQLIAEREAQRIADSIAQAGLMADAEERRIADSIAQAELQRRLEYERSRRSEAEQRMLSTGMLELEALQFPPGRATIDRGSGLYLTQIARMLVKYPLLRIEIGGHTDNTGGLDLNMRLSAQRAEAVFLHMINVEPALAQMLTHRGYGPTAPKADNSTPAGREANRRVELRVLNPEVLRQYE